MANPLEMLGIGSNGLGAAVTGLQALQSQDLQQQMGLADLAAKQQAAQQAQLQMAKDQLGLEEARQLSPSKVAAGIAGNESAVGEGQLKKQQQFGQMVGQMGQAFERIPPAQRQQYLQQMAQRVPGIAEDPTFLSLMNTDPDDLPLALRKVGNDILLNTGDQLRSLQLQKAKDDAAMARTQVSEAGANSRESAGNAAALERTRMQIEANKDIEQKRIDAGKYNKKDVMADPASAILKYGPEKLSAMALYEASKADNPEEKAYWNQLGAQAASLGSQFRSAGATPKQVIDPNAPGGIGQVNPYGQQGVDPFTSLPQSQQAAPIPGLPQGTVNNGDGTFTLPDGRRIRRKQ